MINVEKADSTISQGFQELHFACASKRKDQVIRLLSEGKEPNSRDPHGDSCLHIVSRNNCPEILKILIDQKADLDSRDDNGATPLHTAATSSSVECLRLLVGSRADTEMKNSSNQTALDVCNHAETAELFRSILGKSNSSDRNGRRNSRELSGFSELHYACASKRVEQVVAILAKGNIDTNHRDIYGETGLHLAAQNGSANILSVLIEGNADVNAQNDRGNTPLHVAAQHSLDDCVRLLIDLGADTSINNRKNQLAADLCKRESTRAILTLATASQPNQSQKNVTSRNIGEDFSRLSLACLRGDRPTIRELVNNTPSLLNEKSSYGDTAFHIACTSGNADIAKLLLDLKADPAVRNIRSKTGFEEAAIAGFPDLSDQINDIKCESCECAEAAKDYDSGSRLSYTDLQYACARNNFEKVAEIFAKGLSEKNNVNKVNVYGDTALHYAARSASIGIIKILIANKANVNATSVSSGDNPVILAIRRGNREIVKTLIDAGADLTLTNKKGQSGQAMLNEKGLVIGNSVGAGEESSFTPLMYACVKGDLENTKKILEEKKGTVWDVNVYGDSALSYACLGKSIELVKFLISADADVNHVNSLGDTPLHMAVANGTKEVALQIVKVLIGAGADPTIRNHKGKTARDMCKNPELLTELP